MAKVGVKYDGLHERNIYEGLTDYSENTQEKIIPHREAKFVRECLQYQQLLNEGSVEVEKQQRNQIKEEQEERAVIRMQTIRMKQRKNLKL